MNTFLACALVALGAIHDMNYLDAKKELVEITGHPELVTDSAGGDFSDHVVPERPKAGTYLNKANRRIEEALPELKQQEIVELQIAAGQFEVDVPGIRYVADMRLKDSAQKATGLRQRTYEWVVQTYARLLSAIVRGIPLYWGRGSGSSTVFSSISTDENSFARVSSDATHLAVSLQDASEVRIYSLSSGALVDSWAVTSPTDVAIYNNEVYVCSSGEVQVYQKDGTSVRSFDVADAVFVSVYNNEIYVTTLTPEILVFDLDGNAIRDIALTGWSVATHVEVSSGGVVATGLLTAGGASRLEVFTHYGTSLATRANGTTIIEILSATAAGIYTVPVNSSTVTVYDYTLTATTGVPVSLQTTSYGRDGSSNGSHMFVMTRQVDGIPFVQSYSLGALKAAGFFIAPPADEAYTLIVKGGYYAHAFEQDEDETWASVNCPDAMLLMAKAYVALLVDNDPSTFKMLEKQALDEASERWANMVHEQVLGIPYEEQRFGPISFGRYDVPETPTYQWESSV